MPPVLTTVPVRERLVSALSASSGPLCDDCLSERSSTYPRQQVNLLARQLAEERLVIRSLTVCSSCGRRKLANGLSDHALAPATPRRDRTVRRKTLQVPRTIRPPVAIAERDEVIRLGRAGFEFVHVGLVFDANNISDVFRFKNNRSVAETLEQPRYRHLREDVLSRYAQSVGRPLGEFLYEVKEKGDPIYKAFLNPYGDEEYCSFAIADPSVARSRGVYLYVARDMVRYVGRCLDSFSKRIDQGYGRIHPKNCYLDGQSTNCRLNSLIAKHRDLVSLYICGLDDASAIVELEAEILRSLSPEWNILGV